MTRYCKEHVPEGTEWEDATWGRCSVCGRKGGVVVVEEVALEAEPEVIDDVQVKETTEETTTEETEARAESEGELSKEPEHDKVSDTIQPTEEPLEAEPEPEFKASPESMQSEIDALRAQLAKLEPEEK